MLTGPSREGLTRFAEWPCRSSTSTVRIKYLLTGRSEGKSLLLVTSGARFIGSNFALDRIATARNYVRSGSPKTISLVVVHALTGDGRPALDTDCHALELKCA